MKFPEMTSEEYVELIKRLDILGEVRHVAYQHTFQSYYEHTDLPENLMTILGETVGMPGYMTAQQMYGMLSMMIDKFTLGKDQWTKGAGLELGYYDLISRRRSKGSPSSAWLVADYMEKHLIQDNRMWWPRACSVLCAFIRDYVDNL